MGNKWDSFVTLTMEALRKTMTKSKLTVMWKDRSLKKSPLRDRMFLAAMLLDPRDVAKYAENDDFHGSGLKTSFFSEDTNAIIFEHMAHLWRHGQSVDLITLTELMHKHRSLEVVGGAVYLADLINSIVPPIAQEADTWIHLDA